MVCECVSGRVCGGLEGRQTLLRSKSVLYSHYLLFFSLLVSLPKKVTRRMGMFVPPTVSQPSLLL